MKLKRLLFRLLGKDPDAAVVSFCSGPPELAERMVAEVRALVPNRQHFAVSEYPVAGAVSVHPRDLPGPLRRKRIGLAPTLFVRGEEGRAIRGIAVRMAPGRILAYNEALERHHLKLSSPIASFLFLRGVPLDRIWLRPKWFPFRRERSSWPNRHYVTDGRGLQEGRRRVAILSPYFPWPLSHGGAVRIYNLLREASGEFDVFLFSFAERPQTAATGSPLTDFCAKVITFPNPRYREPRWASLRPPEVNEFTSGYVARIVDEFCVRYGIRLRQVEYTQMAAYSGDVLVEHDVTFDLQQQVYRAAPGLSTWWNLFRWKRFEQAAVKRLRSVVVMSAQDARLLPDAQTAVIPNGVDLQRFTPEPEKNSGELLFIGSFAHFPNVVACRWFLQEVWPLLSGDVRLTIIAGKNPERYWSDAISDDRVELHSFISDVRPFYHRSNVVIVPTRVSAGTNLKVLEAMAMERAVVSTTSGINGLDLVSGVHVLVADEAQEFASALTTLLSEDTLRRDLAVRARAHAQAQYGWKEIAVSQRKLWRILLMARGVTVRKGRDTDLPSIHHIQLASHGASQWEPDSYFMFDVQVAELDGTVAGFVVSRVVGPDEAEVLNLAVAPEARRRGVGTALLDSLTEAEVFLEVRESNTGARNLYRKQGFRMVGRRDDYYEDPPEAALVLRRSASVPTER